MPRSRWANHLSKRHWNTITLGGSVPDDEVLELIGHAYDLVVVHLTKAQQSKLVTGQPIRCAYGHTPLSAAEDIPWRCRRLVIGTGAEGALPVLQQVREEVRRRKIDLVVVPTAEAIGVLAQTTKDTNAILHLTC